MDIKKWTRFLSPTHAPWRDVCVSQANLPNITPTISLTRDEAISLLISSIALQELGLSHIINAEAESLQYVLGTLRRTPLTPVQLAEIYRISCSARDTIRELKMLEMLLQSKLETVKAFGTSTCNPEPAPAPDPNPPPDPQPDPPNPNPNRSNHPHNSSDSSNDPPRRNSPFRPTARGNPGWDDAGDCGERDYGSLQKSHGCVMRNARQTTRQTSAPKKRQGGKPCLTRRRKRCRRKHRCAIKVCQANRQILKNVIVITNIARNKTAVSAGKRKATGSSHAGSPCSRTNRPGCSPHRKFRRCPGPWIRGTAFPGRLPGCAKPLRK